MIAKQDKRKRVPLNITLSAAVADRLAAFCVQVGAMVEAEGDEPRGADLEYVVEEILRQQLAVELRPGMTEMEVAQTPRKKTRAKARAAA